MGTIRCCRLRQLLFATLLIMSTLFTSLADAQQTDRSPETVTFGADRWLEVAGITEAQAPRVFDDLVVFSFEQPRYARYVAAAFAHEGYRELHVFSARRREGRGDLFYLAYPVDPEWSRLEYRLVVDGVWLVDPHSPEVIRDDRGVEVGRVSLRVPPPYRQQSPIVHGDGTVTFMFSFDIRVSPTVETVDGRQLSVTSIRDPRINLVGTFNGWDPFMHRLTGPDENGFYSLRLPVSEGSHYYYFMINGHRVLDSFNRERARDLQTDALTNMVVVRR